jgi:argininosuccinate lyase
MLMEEFSSSLPVDRLMWREDVAVNRAWAGALRRASLLSSGEERKIQRVLSQIEKEFEREKFDFLPSDEDIHVAIERRLTELAGPAGAKIHTGRSRNDQVTTDFRLYLKRRVGELQNALCEAINAGVEQAEKNTEIIMPGYTHTQQAQPLRLSQYLLSLFQVLRRHHRQLAGALDRLDEMPLGSGALAGSAFSIDRQRLARELGFSRVAENSVDATGSRDFCTEIVFVCASISITLSRYAGDFILWASQEFGFLDPGETFATGSSMMPNKKNPDAFELIRGKAAEAIGKLSAILSLQKGTPVTYSRDLQEDKRITFEALATTHSCLLVFAGALASSRFRIEKIRAALDTAMLATDVADYLVRKGVPFRDAHRVVGNAVRHAETIGWKLHELPLAFWQTLSPLFDESIQDCFDFEKSVERRNAIGGTSHASVARQLQAARRWLRQRKSKT